MEISADRRSTITQLDRANFQLLNTIFHSLPHGVSCVDLRNSFSFYFASLLVKEKFFDQEWRCQGTVKLCDHLTFHHQVSFFSPFCTPSTYCLLMEQFLYTLIVGTRLCILSSSWGVKSFAIFYYMLVYNGRSCSSLCRVSIFFTSIVIASALSCCALLRFVRH